MLKRLILILLSGMFCMSVCACGGRTSTEQESESEALTPAPESEEAPIVWRDEVPKTLKILAIGNSFSVDAMEYLYRIAKSAGVEEIVLGDLYIGSCTLETHVTHAKKNDSAYTYYKNASGNWTTTADTSFLTGLKDEEWDVITVQQSSKVAGFTNTYDIYLTQLLDEVRREMPNPNAEIFFHMTWASQQGYSASFFQENYGGSQLTMYSRIVSAVQKTVMQEPRIVGLIPNATAIQNARTSFVGDNLTRDGHHLSYTLGRYIAGLTFFSSITGIDPERVTYVPSADITPEVRAMAISSVKDAIVHPFRITPSEHLSGEWSAVDKNFDKVVNPGDCYDLDATLASGVGIDLTKYRILEYEYIENGFYNCLSSSKVTNPAESASSYKQNVCTKKIFTKAEIPEGSVIICDLGWQYRPEMWVNTSQKATARPTIITAAVTVLDASFWGNDQYLAWNISSSPKGDISALYAAAASHVRVYIPVASN